MLQLISLLMKVLYPIIKQFLPNFSFSPTGDNFATQAFAKIKDLVETKEIELPKKNGKRLNVNKVEQFKIREDNNEFACLYSGYVMTGSYVTKKAIVPEQFDDVCVEAGAMNRSFKILNHDKMLQLAGIKGAVSEKLSVTKANIVEFVKRVKASIDANLPVIVSLSGGVHYELIVGYEYKNDELVFEVIDPGGWNDTNIETSTLRFYKVVKGKRVYSQNSGVQRIVTSVRFVKKP